MAENGEMTDDSKGFVSARGPFEIFENPPIKAPYPSEAVNEDQAADGFEYGDLAEEYGEEPVRQKNRRDG
jgi:hypothetical protein